MTATQTSYIDAHTGLNLDWKTDEGNNQFRQYMWQLSDRISMSLVALERMYNDNAPFSRDFLSTAATHLAELRRVNERLMVMRAHYKSVPERFEAINNALKTWGEKWKQAHSYAHSFDQWFKP